MEMTAAVHESVSVAHVSDASAGRRAAVAMGERAGYREEELGRLAVVVTELATNLVKHTRNGGVLLLAPGAAGIEVVSVDDGPGMVDVQRCLTDGHSTAGSAGTGLGAIQRLANEFEVYSVPGAGTLAVAVVGPRDSSPGIRRFNAAGISVPMSGESANGDRWACRQDAGALTLMVVDGLGHGVLAEEAATTAVGVFHVHAPGSVEGMLDVVHRALRPTRGAAIAVAQIDGEHRVVEYAGIGNISGVIVSEGGTRQLVSMNGIAGHGTPRIKSFTYPWSPSSILVMHSDGVSARWDLSTYPGLASRPPLIVAAALYRDFLRGRDDATVAVAREQPV